ncbi:MAG: hypothetical protein HRT57_18060 [Crocinitomicaceae bacterium]|nr:hypothetical protein [Crocinitomicaceae bacterium]
MKACLIFFLFPVSLFAQNFDKIEIETYVATIDSLNNNHQLEVFVYLKWSNQGGTVNGYYLEGNLVYLKAYMETEGGFIQKEAYFNQGLFSKIVFSSISNSSLNGTEYKGKSKSLMSNKDSLSYYLFDGSDILYNIKHGKPYHATIDKSKLSEF